MPGRRSQLLSLALAMLGLVLMIGLAACGSDGDAQATPTNPTTATPAQLESPSLPGKVVFVGDFEGPGFPEWYLQALPGRYRIVRASPFEGRGNARFEVRPGDVEPETGSNRAEATGPTFHAGDDLYVRTAFRIPQANTFHGNWELIQQFHESDGWEASPGTAVFLTSHRQLRIGHGDSSQIDWQSKPLAKGRWYDLTYRVNFSRNPKVGFVEAWLDGVKQRLRNGKFREYGFTTEKPDTYLKTGIYRDAESHGISVIEIDSVVITKAPR